MKTKNNVKRKNILLSITITIIVLAVIILRLISNKRSLDSEIEMVKNFNTTIPVLIDTVKNRNISDEFKVNGSFSAMQELTVISETQGRIISINTDEGKKVSANQILAITDNELLKSQLELAKVNLDKTKKDMERFEKLSVEDAVSRQQYESAKLGLSGAESGYIAAKKQYENSIIKAPFDGIITKKYIEKGAFLMTGAQVFDIIDIKKVKFTAKLTDEEVKKVSNGQKVKLTSDSYKGYTYEGIVSSIITKADPSRKYEVEIEVINKPDKILKPGMFGYAVFGGESGELLVIPRKALAGSIKNPEVFLVKGDSVVLQSIMIEYINENYLMVKEGLEKGDIVVTSGQINLKPGSKIKIQ
jgi:membrane fusion protein, multidrug efflux system